MSGRPGPGAGSRCPRSGGAAPRPPRWSPGLRNVFAVTMCPRRARLVTAASARERRPALELVVDPVALVAQEVVVHPEVVEPGRLRVDDGVAQLRPARPLDPERRAEPHLHRPYRTDVADLDEPVRAVPPEARDAILAWYDLTGRQLAFRSTADPYAVLVSELMAQQTQAQRAAEAWTAWMARWPSVASLAAAPVADVLRAWKGLGYNRRALNLHRAAQAIVERAWRAGAIDRGRARGAPGCRPLHRPGGGRDRVPGAGRGGRHQRAARPRADRGRRSRGVPGRVHAGARRRHRAARPAGRLDPRADGPRRPPVPRRSGPGARTARRSRGAGTRRASARCRSREPCRLVVPCRASRRPTAGSGAGSSTRARAAHDGEWIPYHDPIGEHGHGAVREAVVALSREGLLDARDTPAGMEARLPR